MYPTSILVFQTDYSEKLKCRLGGMLWSSLGGCEFSLDEVEKCNARRTLTYVQGSMVDQCIVFEITAHRD